MTEGGHRGEGQGGEDTGGGGRRASCRFNGVGGAAALLREDCPQREGRMLLPQPSPHPITPPPPVLPARHLPPHPPEGPEAPVSPASPASSSAAPRNPFPTGPAAGTRTRSRAPPPMAPPMEEMEKGGQRERSIGLVNEGLSVSIMASPSLPCTLCGGPERERGLSASAVASPPAPCAVGGFPSLHPVLSVASPPLQPVWWAGTGKGPAGGCLGPHCTLCWVPGPPLTASLPCPAGRSGMRGTAAGQHGERR